MIYTYDELNCLKTVTSWLGQVVTYYYDDAGRLDYFTQFNGIKTDYDYDDANRLTFLQHKDMAANRTIARYTFTLDDNGNRETAKVIEPLDPAISTANVPYTYNPKKNRLVNVGGTSLTYDDEGQLQSMGGVNYNFDYEHRLVSAGTSTYAYDGSGNRLRATHAGVQTKYIYDLGGNLLAEADAANNIIAYYVHGLGLLAMVTPDNQTFCYHYDGSGNTIAITDLSKTIRNTYAYTPFGTITENESFDQPFTFSGQYGVMQEPSRLYYMRARYYDPVIGRFISEDPTGFGGGDVNLFAYVGNNPVNRIDPLGCWYVDINVGVGWMGGVGTGGVMFSDKGIYYYSGGGAGTPGPSGAITWSILDPTPGWNFGVQGGGFLGVLGGQVGTDIKGNPFWEVGFVSPGFSGTGYYVKKLGEQSENINTGDKK